MPGRVLTRMGVDPRTGEIDDAPTTAWSQQPMSRFDLRPETGSMLFSVLNRFSDLQLGRVNDGAVANLEGFRTSSWDGVKP